MIRLLLFYFMCCCFFELKRHRLQVWSDFIETGVHRGSEMCIQTKTTRLRKKMHISCTNAVHNLHAHWTLKPLMSSTCVVLYRISHSHHFVEWISYDNFLCASRTHYGMQCTITMVRNENKGNNFKKKFHTTRIKNLFDVWFFRRTLLLPLSYHKMHTHLYK